MVTKIKDLIKGESFLKDVLTTLSGGVFGAVIGFAMLPVFSRIYEPEDFGVAQFIISATMNFAIIACLRYPSGIVLPKDKSKLNALISLSFYVSFFFCIVGVFLFFFFSEWIGSLLNLEGDLHRFLIFIPLFSFLISVNDILTNWDVRDKQFKKLASSQVFAQISGVIVKLVFGLLHFTGIGLIVGFFIQQLTRVYLRIKSRTKNLIIILKTAKKEELIEVAKEYQDFPKYMLPGNWINNFSRELPIFIFTAYYSPGLVGHFAFANTILLVPFSLVSRAVNPVFLQKSNELYHKDFDKLKSFIKSIVTKLVMLGCIPFGIMTFFGDMIFPFVFGSKWGIAGEISCYISLYMIIRLLFTPLTPIFRVFNLERYTLYVGLILVIVRGIAIMVGVHYFDMMMTVKLFCFASLFCYILASLLVFDILEIKWWGIKTIAKFVLPSFAILYVIRKIVDFYL